MDDEHYLALGRAVYAFQMVEWLTIWIAALLDDGDVARYDDKTFGQLVRDLESKLRQDPMAGGAIRSAVEDLVTLLRTTNTLRQDVFHSHPVERDKVLRRRRKTGMIIPIDARRLDAASHRFDIVTREAQKVFEVLWQQASVDGRS